jgi:predicted RNA-binding Zn-ribbon protein involved in translation (DUF1610 family)
MSGRVTEDTESCPACGADWRDEPIPENIRHHYGDRTHFSRRIGIYDMGSDRTVAWRCPDCGKEWPR